MNKRVPNPVWIYKKGIRRKFHQEAYAFSIFLLF
jgi:hypothetical protein